MIRFPAVRKVITSEKRASLSLSMVIGLVAAATAIRWALSMVGANLTFVTYFPAVLLCSLLTGWRYGAVCAVLSGIIASGLFPISTAAAPFHFTSAANLVAFWVSCAAMVATADALQRAVRELGEANRLAHVLNQELQHRVGNILTVVQAIASQTAKGASTQEFVDAFSGRLQALNRANGLLGRWTLETCALPDLVDVACEPFCKGDNLVKSGPSCLLPAKSCVPLVLALHELCTNAVKYGALSMPEGRVRITWEFSEEPQRLNILWEEVGGPPVSNPSRKGFGSKLLQPQPGISAVHLVFDRSGVRCQLCVDGAEPLAGSPRNPTASSGFQHTASGVA